MNSGKLLYEQLLSPEAQDFIRDHGNEDSAEIALRYGAAAPAPIAALAEQIALRKKAASKLPSLAKTAFLYERVALEQCSSEATARYKASIMKGHKLIDLTGGMGIDTLAFNKSFDEVVYCEEDERRVALFEVNLRSLDVQGISVRPGNGVDTIGQFADGWFDWVYVDPCRRSEGRREVALDRYRPDVTHHAPRLLTKGHQVCIKASPALDISSVLGLPGLHAVHVVSVHGECKELLIFLSRSHAQNPPVVSAIILSEVGQPRESLSAPFTTRPQRTVADSVGAFLFDPDPAIVKAGLAPILAASRNLLFVNDKVDFLTAQSNAQDFPGRSFRVIAVLPWQRRSLGEYLKNNGITRASIVRRDFPLQPEEIRRLYQLGESDRDYLFFTCNRNHAPIFIHAHRVVA